VVSVGGGSPVSIKAGAISGKYEVKYSITGIPGEGFAGENGVSAAYEIQCQPYTYLKAEIKITNTGTAPDYGDFVYGLDFSGLPNTVGTSTNPIIGIDSLTNTEPVGENYGSVNNFLIFDAGTTNQASQYGVLAVGATKSFDVYIPIIKFYGLAVTKTLSPTYDGNQTQGYDFDDALNFSNTNSPVTVNWCQKTAAAVDDVFGGTVATYLGLS